MDINMEITAASDGNPVGIIYDEKQITNKRKELKTELFNKTGIESESFASISEYDIYIIYKLYDSIFLDGWFADNLKGKITFKMSRQLRRAAGNTTAVRSNNKIPRNDMKFEVKLSLDHLMCFYDSERIKTVGGIEALSRLDSLLLVLEHELCHVIEFILFNSSDCKGFVYQSIIRDIFGHREATHNLISKAESNWIKYGFKKGDNVKFEYKGKVLNGIIVNINKNAVMMSLDMSGKYMDKQGKRYSKYIVPLDMLKKIN